jgi:non-heme chloroperoxidase
MVDFRRLRRDGRVSLGLVQAEDGALIMVETAGAGRPLLLVHGWSMSRRFWRRQMEALSDRFMVVAPDLRAHGDSSKALFGLTLPRCARDLQDVIEALDLHDVVLAGWSLAGPLALEHWQQYGGDRIQALALVEMTPAPLAAGEWNTHKLAGMNLDGLADSLCAVQENRRDHLKAFVHGMFHGGAAPEADHAFMLAEALKTPALAAASLYSDYLLRDYRDVLPTVTAPALVAVGREAPICFGEACGRYVAGKLPRGDLRVFKDSGHLPFWEEPAAFNQALIDLSARI